MKIGFEVKPFNYNLKSRRLELGYTQKRLSFEAQVPIDLVGCLELLKMPSCGIRLARERMNKIARTLDVEFDWVFPQDYLEAIQHKLLPRRKKPIVWVIDLDILQLQDDILYALPSPETEIVEMDLQEDVCNAVSVALDCLSDRQREVVERRYGFNGYEPATLEEVAFHIGVPTRERVRQIEARAIRKLRHPIRTRPIREARIIEG